MRATNEHLGRQLTDFGDRLHLVSRVRVKVRLRVRVRVKVRVRVTH